MFYFSPKKIDEPNSNYSNRKRSLLPVIKPQFEGRRSDNQQTVSQNLEDDQKFQKNYSECRNLLYRLKKITSDYRKKLETKRSLQESEMQHYDTNRGSSLPIMSPNHQQSFLSRNVGSIKRKNTKASNYSENRSTSQYLQNYESYPIQENEQISVSSMRSSLKVSSPYQKKRTIQSVNDGRSGKIRIIDLKKVHKKKSDGSKLDEVTVKRVFSRNQRTSEERERVIQEEKSFSSNSSESELEKMQKIPQRSERKIKSRRKSSAKKEQFFQIFIIESPGNKSSSSKKYIIPNN